MCKVYVAPSGFLVIKQPGAQWFESRLDQYIFFIFFLFFVIFPANFKNSISNQIYEGHLNAHIDFKTMKKVLFFIG